MVVQEAHALMRKGKMAYQRIADTLEMINLPIERGHEIPRPRGGGFNHKRLFRC